MCTRQPDDRHAQARTQTYRIAALVKHNLSAPLIIEQNKFRAPHDTLRRILHRSRLRGHVLPLACCAGERRVDDNMREGV